MCGTQKHQRRGKNLFCFVSFRLLPPVSVCSNLTDSIPGIVSSNASAAAAVAAYRLEWRAAVCVGPEPKPHQMSINYYDMDHHHSIAPILIPFDSFRLNLFLCLSPLTVFRPSASGMKKLINQHEVGAQLASWRWNERMESDERWEVKWVNDMYILYRPANYISRTFLPRVCLS